MAYVDFEASAAKSASSCSADLDCVMPELYGRVVRMHLPPGPAWWWEDEGEADSLARALGYEYSRVECLGRDLLAERDPRKAVDLLDAYENAYGLPGSCGTAPTELATRQTNLFAKVRARGGSNHAYFYEIGKSLGYTIGIDSGAELFTTLSNVRQALYGAVWVHYWQVVYEDGDLDELLTCRIAEFNPLHAVVGFVLWSWHWSDTGSALSEDLYDVCFDRGRARWVCVGENGEMGVTDADAEIWVDASIPAMPDFRGVSSDGFRRFVAVATGGAIWTSDDGTAGTWAATASPTTEDLYAVAWGDTLAQPQFLAVGDNGTILASDDGLGWSDVAPPSVTDDFRAVRWCTDHWVLVGASGALYTSPDGRQWVARTSGTANELRAIAQDDEGMVIVAGDLSTLRASTDQATWSTITLPFTDALNALGWHPVGRWALGTQAGNLWSSIDGESWTLRGTDTDPINAMVGNGVETWIAVGDGAAIRKASV